MIILPRTYATVPQYLCKRFKTILNRMQTEEQIKEQLTLREMEVLQAIAKGFNTREIADLLHVSNNTIETHRKSLMSKLEARNAVDLVLKAINLGIIPLDCK
ncbi:response regulator transcription factor [Phocaeicola plebeius]|uniref:response regulator transcription factor n=1 Tax=Phocaeicola plebeius TaxID=310297 RepID=UPI0026F30002|nr:LuxR C-terminal-related transcriptional regulator [Phocaeicola plebeius]MCI6051099.1 LuxR C-terminal-related transcriptional regulator [Phocaeicola plebeius]MDD6914021.1 LuxR C-terminal-related transcriptional regulator [Phocaeicola plebeius]MDY5977256.1 LuxR C-terminal-related transcriptional regulator [Phocaeicola plebeius]